MIYDYECLACDHVLDDVYQSIHDDPLVTCPNCGKNYLFRVISGGLHCSVQNITTVGQLADKNARENRGKLNEAEARKREENPQTKQWYENPKYGSATNKEISQMSKSQLERYVMEGRK